MKFDRIRHIALIGIAAALLSSASPSHANPPARPAGIPVGNVQLSPCIPTMGEHWGVPATATKGGEIYGIYQGKPVFTEIMITPKDFAAGKSWNEVLKPLPGYNIDHVDIWFLPHGHPGMKFPHYDMHAFYVPHATHMAFCGGPAALAKMMKM